MEQDGLEQTYALIEQKRLPSSIQCLRAPWKWSIAETTAWWDHASRGEAGELDPPNESQFLQARPKEYNWAVCASGHPEACMSYPPDSLRFYENTLRAAAKEPAKDREDKLPYFRSGETYIPFSETQLAKWEYLLNIEEACREMVELLFEFEALAPPEVCN